MSDKYIPLCIRKIRDGEEITIHANKECTKAGSRFYLDAGDVASALMFILTSERIAYHIQSIKSDTIHCPKFNIVGPSELDNLQVAQIIAETQQKELKYRFVDFHSSRPGHDTRYSLSGNLMKSLGWTPQISVEERLKEMTHWSLANPRWLLT